MVETKKPEWKSWQKKFVAFCAIFFGFIFILGVSGAFKTEEQKAEEAKNAEIEQQAPDKTAELNKWFEEDYKKREENQLYYEGQ